MGTDDADKRPKVAGRAIWQVGNKQMEVRTPCFSCKFSFFIFSQVVVDSYSLKKGASTKAMVILRLQAKEQKPFTLQVDFHQESSKVQIIPKAQL